jgi:hypothetical protein
MSFPPSGNAGIGPSLAVNPPIHRKHAGFTSNRSRLNDSTNIANCRSLPPTSRVFVINRTFVRFELPAAAAGGPGTFVDASSDKSMTP